MKDLELEVGLSPPEEQKADDEKTNLVLEFITEKGIAYPAEISGFLDIPKDTCYRKLRFLEGQGKIERLTLEGKMHVPDWLQPRLKELWSRGIKGNAIRRISWYTLTKEGEKVEKTTA